MINVNENLRQRGIDPMPDLRERPVFDSDDEAPDERPLTRNERVVRELEALEERIRASGRSATDYLVDPEGT